ncbi:MAG: bacteriocin [Planctomycetes bacterium]|nr:bacteriocin [Planctomycetota bacterium]
MKTISTETMQSIQGGMLWSGLLSDNYRFTPAWAGPGNVIDIRWL